MEEELKPEMIMIVYNNGSIAYFPVENWVLFEAAIKDFRDEQQLIQSN